MADLFRRAGTLREAYDQVAWERTALGAVPSWSPALRSAVDLTLNTEYAVTLLWGPEFTMIYNAAYVPIIGDKHPAALGASAREVFPEIWDEIGPLMQGVFDGNGPVWLDGMRLLMHRRGFDEECFFNFCYSPLGGTEGPIEGVIDIVAETTPQVVAWRRLQLLTALDHALSADVATPAEMVEVALPVLRAALDDLPSVDVRLVTEDGPAAEWVSSDAWDAAAVLQQTPNGEVAWLRLNAAAPTADRASLRVGISPHLRFDDHYRDFLRLIAAKLTQTLDRIAARALERVTAATERRLSDALQRSLLTAPAQPDGMQIAVRYQPAAELARVGGDWYDAFVLPDGSVLVTIGDVIGHDGTAAAAMAQLRNMLRGIAYGSDRSPAVVLADLDRAMSGLGTRVFATAVIARIHGSPSSGGLTLTYSNAGHPAPALTTADAVATLLPGGADLPLGVEVDRPRSDISVDLQPGSSLVLYTDGLIERRTGADLSEGFAALTERVRAAANASAEELAEDLMTYFGPHATDDVALLVVHLRSAGDADP